MVVMGRVRAPHGIKGWVKIQPFTQEVEGLLDYPEWWLGRNGEWQAAPRGGNRRCTARP